MRSIQSPRSRWAWHSQRNPRNYRLRDVAERYAAYGREVQFPTRTDTPAADWLRRNPHDLPLARIGFVFDGESLAPEEISEITQHLDLWRGILDSRFTLAGQPVHVTTAVHSARDVLSVRIESPLLASGRLTVSIRFPRRYDPAVKNTPDMEFGSYGGHLSKVAVRNTNSVVIERRVDDNRHFVRVSWNGEVNFEQTTPHAFVLLAADAAEQIDAGFEFSNAPPSGAAVSDLDAVVASSATGFERFWQGGAAIDFSGSTDLRAAELERRIVLSRYLLAVQSRAEFPAQETGLTSSSRYGKLHTEMSWWNSAHWALWGRPQYTERVLFWYLQHLAAADPSCRDRVPRRERPGGAEPLRQTRRRDRERDGLDAGVGCRAETLLAEAADMDRAGDLRSARVTEPRVRAGVLAVWPHGRASVARAAGRGTALRLAGENRPARDVRTIE